MRMRRFRLNDSIERIRNVMVRLTLPPTCDVCLSAVVHGEDDHTAILPSIMDQICVAHLTSMFPTTTIGTQLNGFTRLELSEHEDYTGNVGFTLKWTKPNLSQLSHARLSFALAIPDRAEGEPLLILLEHVFEHWPGCSPYVLHLCIEHDDLFIQWRDWLRIFYHFYALRALTVTGTAASTLPKALYEDGVESITLLETLSLEKARLSSSEYKVFLSQLDTRRMMIEDPDLRIPRRLSLVECVIGGERFANIHTVVEETTAEASDMTGNANEDGEEDEFTGFW